MNPGQLAMTLPADHGFYTWTAYALQDAERGAKRNAERLDARTVERLVERHVASNSPHPMWRVSPVPASPVQWSMVAFNRERVRHWGMRLPRLVVAFCEPADDRCLGAARLDLDVSGLYVSIRLHVRLAGFALPAIYVHELRHAQQFSDSGLWRKTCEDLDKDADLFAAKVLAVPVYTIGRDALVKGWR